MKKTLISAAIVLVIVLVYLVVQNNQLQEDVADSQAKAKELNNYIDKTKKQTIHFSANDPANTFIHAYFDFKDHPKKKDVESLVTDKAMEKLDFGDASQGGEKSQVESKVEDLKIYYGDATDQRQELFGTFTTKLTYNDVTSKKDSYIKLDMIKKGGTWKVDDFAFNQ